MNTEDMNSNELEVIKLIEDGSHYTGVYDITPTLAQYILDNLNTQNRKPNPNHVSRIAISLVSDQWVMNGESIVFSDKGLLVDGQHRLMACAQTGVAIKSVVVFGVPNRDAFNTHGQGVTRTASQVLSMNGFSNTTSLGAACKFALFFKGTKGLIWDEDETKIKAKAPLVSRDMILEMATSLDESVISKVSDIHSNVPSSIGRACVSGMFLFLCEINKEAAFIFFNKVVEDDFVGKTDPARLIKRYLSRTTKGFKISVKGKYFMACYVIQAWNLFISNQERETLLVYSKKPTPVPLIPTDEQMEKIRELYTD
jgi:hypothetical protein